MTITISIMRFGYFKDTFQECKTKASCLLAFEFGLCHMWIDSDVRISILCVMRTSYYNCTVKNCHKY